MTFNGTVAGWIWVPAVPSLCCLRRMPPNWIKVVQRLPVRVELDPQQVARYPLRIGLSMNVTIETKNTDGPVLANVQRDTPPLRVMC